MSAGLEADLFFNDEANVVRQIHDPFMIWLNFVIAHYWIPTAPRFRFNSHGVA